MSAIVLGVGPGLGLALAQAYGETGRKVAVVSRREEDAAAFAADLPDAVGFAADLGDPAAVTETTSPWQFKDYVSDKNPFCTEDKNCPQGWFCSWDINKCEPPVPVIISPTLLEFYNGSFARMYGLPRITGFLVGQLRGLLATAEPKVPMAVVAEATSISPR